MARSSIGNLLCIPARGGSKRLPRKNLAMVGSKPMVVHTIEAALSAGVAERAYVCTEDEDIGRVAEAHGATVFPIPQSMAGDEVSSTVPCLALYESRCAQGERIEYIFNLQPTSPLRTGRDIRNALAALRQSGADFLVSVTPIDPHYFHWVLIEQGEYWGMFFGRRFLKERTLLPPVFRPNGSIKAGRASRVNQVGHFFGDPLKVYEMPEERSIHVATKFDLDCAQAMFEQLAASPSRSVRAARGAVRNSERGG